jgi:putative restriction endonuclease
MRTAIDQRERAKRAWDILTELAKSKQHTTYGELAKRMGVHHRACRYFLGLIQEHCRGRELPLLHYLVVNRSSGKPGGGCIGADVADVERVQQAVCAHEWSRTPNPF